MKTCMAERVVKLELVVGMEGQRVDGCVWVDR